MVNGFILRSGGRSCLTLLTVRVTIFLSLLLSIWLRVQVCSVMGWRCRFAVRGFGVRRGCIFVTIVIVWGERVVRSTLSLPCWLMWVNRCVTIILYSLLWSCLRVSRFTVLTTSLIHTRGWVVYWTLFLIVTSRIGTILWRWRDTLFARLIWIIILRWLISVLRRGWRRVSSRRRWYFWWEDVILFRLLVRMWSRVCWVLFLRCLSRVLLRRSGIILYIACCSGMW